MSPENGRWAKTELNGPGGDYTRVQTEGSPTFQEGVLIPKGSFGLGSAG